MSTTAFASNTFLDQMMKSVRRFVQTIVVLDDRADYQSTRTDITTGAEDEYEAVVPTTGDTLLVSESNISSHTEAPNHKGGPLDAAELIDCAARHGIVCAVLKAKPEDDLSQDPLSLAAKNADILILDWEMVKADGKSDYGARAKNAIRNLSNADKLAGGRLRFICIYTCENDLKDCCNRILESLDVSLIEFDGFIDTQKEDFHLNGLTVVFVRKKENSEGQLIDELLKRYEQTVRGLLPRVVLDSVAAVREKTHSLLSRYSADLDGAYLAHRALKSGSTDSEQFITDLVADDIRGILEAYNVGTQTVSYDVIEAYLKDQSFLIRNQKCELCRKTTGNNCAATDGLKILDPNQEEAISKKYTLRSYPLTYPTCGEAESQVVRFASYSSLLRDSFHPALVPANWLPVMKTGTIIQSTKDQAYLLCVQPACDCLRRNRDNATFLFLKLVPTTEAKEMPYVSISINKEENVLLSSSSRAQSIKTIDFGNSVLDKQVVESRRCEKCHRFYFIDSLAVSYHWIGDMRENQTRRMIHRLFDGLSRIGLDEYEWLRLKSEGK